MPSYGILLTVHRNMNFFKSFLLLAFLGFFTTACNSQAVHTKAGHGTESAHHHGEASDAATNSVFQAQLSNVTREYLRLKDALVKSDAGTAKSAAVSMQLALSSVDMKLVTGDAHMEWMGYLKQLKSVTETAVASKSLEDVRQAFSAMSAPLAGAIKRFGGNDTELYLQHCPMAFNNAGGDWLSDVEAVRNPYFGDRMLKCGRVMETIK